MLSQRIANVFGGISRRGAWAPSPLTTVASKARSVAVSAIEVNKVYPGTVKEIRPFGALITLPSGEVGLLHKAQISRERISDVEAAMLFQTGEEVKVLVLSAGGVKAGFKKDGPALSTKHLEQTPGQMLTDKKGVFATADEMGKAYEAARPAIVAARKEALSKIKEGAVVEGRLVSLRAYGALVDIGGVSLLLPSRNMAKRVVAGSTLQVLVTKVDYEQGNGELSTRFKKLENGTVQVLPPKEQKRRPVKTAEDKKETAVEDKAVAAAE